MPKFAASLSWLFQDVPLLERFERAAAAGFQAVEIQNPYDESAESIASELKRHKLKAVLINTSDGLAAVPECDSQFRETLERALSYANVLECDKIHCVAGRTDGDPRAEETYLTNLKWASQQAAAHRVQLMLEPLNDTDNPGYFLTGSEQARRLIDALGSEHVAMQFDAYHIQIMEGSLTQSVRRHLDVITHIQVGGVPGRHEPDLHQEINYPYLFELIDELEFEGWIGCEYAPTDNTDSFTWANRYGIGLNKS